MFTKTSKRNFTLWSSRRRQRPYIFQRKIPTELRVRQLLGLVALCSSGESTTEDRLQGGASLHVGRKKFLLVLSVLIYFSFHLFFYFFMPSYLNCWDALLESVSSQNRHFVAIFASLHPFYTFFPFGIFPNSTYYTFCLFMVCYLFYFMFPDHTIFFELHIDIPNSKTKNKQTKKKQLKRCFTPHCREYCCHHILSSVQRKCTHGICYWLAPNLILNKCACFSSQFFP